MQKESFTLTDGPNGTLRGDVYLPDNPRGIPVVVASHGFKGFKDWGFWPEAGRRFTAADLALVTFNFSGSGIGEDLEHFTEVERFEHDTISKQLGDLARVLGAAADRELPLAGADVRKLGLLGHSRGGGVTLLRAGRDPRAGAVVTWAAVSAFDRYTEKQVREWREHGYRTVVNSRTGQEFRLSTDYLDDLEAHGASYAPVEAVRRLKVPLLLIHGTRDEAVPVEEAELLSRAAAPGTARVALIQGAGHTFGATHPFRGSTPELDQVLEKTVTWFVEALA